MSVVALSAGDTAVNNINRLPALPVFTFYKKEKDTEIKKVKFMACQIVIDTSEKRSIRGRLVLNCPIINTYMELKLQDFMKSKCMSVDHKRKRSKV